MIPQFPVGLTWLSAIIHSVWCLEDTLHILVSDVHQFKMQYIQVIKDFKAQFISKRSIFLPWLVFNHKVIHGATTILPGFQVEIDRDRGDFYKTMNFRNLRLLALCACVQDLRRFTSANPVRKNQHTLPYTEKTAVLEYFIILQKKISFKIL